LTEPFICTITYLHEKEDCKLLTFGQFIRENPKNAAHLDVTILAPNCNFTGERIRRYTLNSTWNPITNAQAMHIEVTHILWYLSMLCSGFCRMDMERKWVGHIKNQNDEGFLHKFPNYVGNLKVVYSNKRIAPQSQKISFFVREKLSVIQAE
jgi:hypothetical protein